MSKNSRLIILRDDNNGIVGTFFFCWQKQLYGISVYTYNEFLCEKWAENQNFSPPALPSAKLTEKHWDNFLDYELGGKKHSKFFAPRPDPDAIKWAHSHISKLMKSQITTDPFPEP